MSLPKFDAVVVLGSRVYKREDTRDGDFNIQPMAAGTIRLHAAARLYEVGAAPLIVISGGPAPGVRYSLDPAQPAFDPPDFSLEAIARALRLSSITEAQVFANILIGRYHISPEAVLIEKMSMTTEGNAKFLRAMFGSYPPLLGIRPENVGLITNYWHMPRALEFFHIEGLRVQPVWAEDVVAQFGPVAWISLMVDYYQDMRGIGGEELQSLREILGARREGVLSRSVEELVSHEPSQEVRAAL